MGYVRKGLIAFGCIAAAGALLPVDKAATVPAAAGKPQLNVAEVSFSKSHSGLTATIERVRIHNHDATAYKDAKLVCTLYGRSGTPIQAFVHTVYDVLPPRASRTFTKIRLGFLNEQAVNGDCVVAGAEKA